MASFDLYYASKLTPIEGGYADVSGDKGGTTYAGISYIKNPQWTGWPIVFAYRDKYGIKSNQRINDMRLESQVKSFYKENYWDKLKADAITNQSIAEIMVDFYINGGFILKKIQSFLNITADGILGNGTIVAINKSNQKGLFGFISNLRSAHYSNIIKADPTQKKFENGWNDRLSKFVFDNKENVTGAAILLVLISAYLILK
jgi:lysozyme family protein